MSLRPVASDCPTASIEYFDGYPPELISKILSYLSLNDRLLNVPLLSKYFCRINRETPVDETTNKMIKIICLLTPEFKGSALEYINPNKNNFWAVIKCLNYFHDRHPEINGLNYFRDYYPNFPHQHQRSGSVQFMNIFLWVLREKAKCRTSLEALSSNTKKEVIEFLIDLWQQGRYHILISLPSLEEDDLEWEKLIDKLSLSPYIVLPFMYSYMLVPDTDPDTLIPDIKMNDSRFPMLCLVFNFLSFVNYLDLCGYEVIGVYQKLDVWFSKIIVQNPFIAHSFFDYMRRCLESLDGMVVVGGTSQQQRQLLVQNIPTVTGRCLAENTKDRLEDLKKCLTVPTENFSMLGWYPCANEFDFNAFIKHLNIYFYTPNEYFQIMLKILFDNEDEYSLFTKFLSASATSLFDANKKAKLISRFNESVPQSNILTMFQENSFEDCLFLLSFLGNNTYYHYYNCNKIAWIITNDSEVQQKCFEYVWNLPLQNMLFKDLYSQRIFEILSLSTISDPLLKKLVEFKSSQEHHRKVFFDYLALCAPTDLLLRVIYIFSPEDQSIGARLLLFQSLSLLAFGLKDFLMQIYLKCDAIPSHERGKVQNFIKKEVFGSLNEEDAKQLKQQLLKLLSFYNATPMGEFFNSFSSFIDNLVV